jgi:hypothetical protein
VAAAVESISVPSTTPARRHRVSRAALLRHVQTDPFISPADLRWFLALLNPDRPAGSPVG